MTSATPTVFIVDDDVSARRALSRLVRVAGHMTESFASARDFLESDCRERAGCVILDVQMPEMTGPELQEALGRSDCDLPIIFLSAHGSVPLTANVMKRGAVDFLTKPVDREDLLAAIQESLERDAARRAEQDMSEAMQERISALTSREHEIMTYVITGMLNKQIGSTLNIAEDTVKIHRGRVMRKLGIVSVPELVRLCERAGVAPAASNRK